MADQLRRPFIYISALVRTGSTLLSEALTQFPHSYIFHEPHLGNNVFAWNTVDTARWKARGLALDRSNTGMKFAALFFRKTGLRPDYVIKTVKRRFLPAFERHAEQIGVKETRNAGWVQYAKHFSQMKVILLGRDPRDIFMSLQEQALLIGAEEGDWAPERLAGQLMQQFEYQQQMLAAADCLAVRYEDLCVDPGVFVSIKEFVRSPIPEMGEIGSFMERFAAKEIEYRRHGRQITAVSVGRWRSETDRAAQAGAFELFDRMRTYTEFWGYQTS